MKLETFFNKFAEFADAPDAVAKMRELILRLAMEGRLVSQDPRDEPADSLAVELIEEAGEKNGRRAAPLPPIAPDEIPFELPAGWVWERLGNIGETNIGLTYSPQDVSEVGTPVLRSSNVQNGKLDFDDLVRVTCEPKQSVMVQDGDLLICARNGSRALVGKVALIENMTEPAAFGAFMAIFRSRVNKFLYHFICSPLFRRMIDEVNTTTINQITQNNLRSTLAPIPPLAEQKRIVAKVNELMALCDRLEAQQQERETQHAVLARAALARFAEAPTPANLDFLFHKSYTISPADLRKSILTLAVQGKLVPQGPNDESAIENLDEIESEKAALIEARKLRPNRVTEISQTKDLQYEVPDSWRWFRLGDVAFFQEGPGIRNWQFRAQGIKLLNVQNIVDGKLVLENTDRHISIEEFESTYRHFAVETGDILFASSGASWGKTAWFTDPGYTVMLNTSMVRLKFYSKRCDDAFLFLFLRTEFFKTQMEIQLVGIQPNFGSTHLGRVYIPLPPLAEQRRIVAKVEQLMALVDALETQLASSRTAAENLLSALVAELTGVTGNTKVPASPVSGTRQRGRPRKAL